MANPVRIDDDVALDDFQMLVEYLTDTRAFKWWLKEKIAPLYEQGYDVFDVVTLRGALVIKQISSDIEAEMFEDIGWEVRTLALQIEHLILIHDIKHGHRMTEQERLRFNASLGVRMSGPWNKPKIGPMHIARMYVQQYRLAWLQYRYRRLAIRYPERLRTIEAF